MNYLKKLSAFFLTAVLLLSGTGCQKSFSESEKKEEQRRFDTFLQQEFIDTMETEYMALHVYVSDPASFGIDKDKAEIDLGSGASEKDQKEAAEAIRTSLKKLNAFSYEALSEEQQDSYDIYQAQLSIQDKLHKDIFSYYPSLFSSMNGLHYQYPILLADWAIRSEEDVKDMLLMVKDILPYTEDALQYTRKQAEKGLLMIDLDTVLTYCKRIVEKGENTSVLTSIYENIDALDIESSKKDDYKKQMKEAIKTSFLPAYARICETMEELKKDGRNNEAGLAVFKNGKEYYELLLQQNSGSDRSLEEIRSMMEDAFTKHAKSFVSIARKHRDRYEAFAADKLPGTGFSSYEELLDHIKGQLETDFPAVAHLTYHIKDIHEEIASDSGVTAYFNIPSLDGTQEKQLRVNPKTNDINSLSTYLTVAHEGFSGHMYQYGYMYENLRSDFRKAIASCSAYTEGYATYAQYECLKYLKEYDPILLELYKEYELMNNCLTLLLDIGIHYDGWTVQDIASYLHRKGLAADENDLKGLYRQLQANPAAFAPYYVGYEEIADRKEKAQKALGKKFTNKGFNEALLESGNAPFEVVQRHIDAYVEKEK